MLLRARGLQRAGIGPLDLDLPAGRCVGLSGPSGSGKTLLLRMLADLDPHDGEVSLDGAAQADVAPSAWRRQVAMLGAESRWWAPTVGAHFAGGEIPLSGALGFDADPAGWSVDRLSTGERERLALARVLALAPRVLLLDEPTANLDEANTARVERVVGEWLAQDGRGVLWVSHDLGQLARVAHVRCALDEGRWTTA